MSELWLEGITVPVVGGAAGTAIEACLSQEHVPTHQPRRTAHPPLLPLSNGASTATRNRPSRTSGRASVRARKLAGAPGFEPGTF